MILLQRRCSDRCSEDCQCISQSPNIAPFLWGICTLSDTWFYWLTRHFVQNGMSIGITVFAQLTVECPITLQWAATFFPKIATFSWGSGSLSNTWYLGPTRAIIPNGSSIGSTVLYWSQMLCCTKRCQPGRKLPILSIPLDILLRRRRIEDRVR